MQRSHLVLLGVAPLILGACDSGSNHHGEPTHGILPGGAAPPVTHPEADAPDEAPEAAAKKTLPAPPAGPHPFSVLDLLAMERLSSVVVSPDGTQVAFVQATTDLTQNKTRSDLFVLPIEGGEPRRLTDDADRERGPQWSSDGSALYFMSARSGSMQVFELALGGGEPRQVTDLPLPVTGFELAGDGKHLLVSLDVFVDCPDLACTKDRLDERAQTFGNGQSYDRVFVRHWDAWKDGTRSHLFSVPLAGDATPRDISSGLDADVPSRPFGGMEEVASSPSGHVIFTARDAAFAAGEPTSTNFDLYLGSVEGTGARRITDNPAWDTKPVLSRDGSRLAYLAMERPGYEADRFRVVVADFTGGPLENPKVVTETLDRSIDELAFSDDGRSLLVTYEDIGQVAVSAIDLETSALTVIHRDGGASSIAPAGESLVFLHNDLSGPDELWTVPQAGGEARPLTAVNSSRLESIARGRFEQFSFRGAGGDEVFGFVVEPVDFDPEQRYPVAFLIHGGPQGSFSNRFHYRWNPQVYAGAGYAVVMIDFHGSTGYGQGFTDAIRGDWGGKPLVDLQLGLEAALEKYPWLDGERACALGASYGGFMINWIAGNWSDRFRCLVNHDGIFDNRMMYYATEELWFPEWEHGAPYYEDPRAYERHNPANHVERWRTPMLVIHGSLDYRVPVEQGIATFTALQRRGVKSRFLHFPSENHWVLEPANSITWHDSVIGWLDEHLEGEEAIAVPTESPP